MDITLQLLLFLALLILVAKTLARLSQRVGLPGVLGELLAGVLLGPTGFDIWRFPWFAAHSTVAGNPPLSLDAVVRVLAQVGVVILMFRAGVETDTEMLKAVAGSAFWAALGGVVLPFAGGSALARAAGFGWPEALFIGTVLTATSVSITAQTLMNLEKLGSLPGSTILGAAVIDDVLGLIVLSLVVAAEVRGQSTLASWSGAGITMARVLAFMLLAFALGPRLVRFVLKSARGLDGPDTPLALALALAFVLAFLAQTLGGMAPITGAYLAGLFTASAPAGARIKEDLRSMTNSLFGPLFFVSIGLVINARQASGHFGFLLLILTVAVLGKVLGCGLGAWLNGLKGQECLAVGVGMIPRGEVGLITASVGWAAGLISPEVYSWVVIVVLATTLLTPFLLRYCFAPSLSLVSGPPRDRTTEFGDPALTDQERQEDPALTGGQNFSAPRGATRSLLVVSLLALAMNTGCSIKRYAINKLGDSLAKSGTTFASDDDPDLVGNALPFSLKLIESLLAESPRHRGLLFAASSGFTQYAYVYVQQDAEENEDRDLSKADSLRARARRLYLRARNYGLRGLEARHRGFEKALRESPKETLRATTKADVPLIYWTAAAWGSAISLSKDNPDLIADQPIVEALIDRALELDESFGDGAIHCFLITYEAARQGAKGDSAVRSRAHFERAVELSHGQLVSPFVALAETVPVEKQDRIEFVSLLKRALAIDPDARPEWRLANIVMQRRARWLLARTDELFAEPSNEPPREGSPLPPKGRATN